MAVTNARGLTRRNWLVGCGAAGAASLFLKGSAEGETLRAAVSAVDHLLLGVSDLDQGIAWVEKRTGVKAAVGGTHPGVGTRNALLSLGGRRYLEIIAPDPAQTAYNFPIDVRKLTEPRLVTWAAGTDDIDSIVKKAREAGHELFGPREGSRKRPDGRVLQWKTLGVLNKLGADGVEPVPFFIAWAADSLHPSQDSPRGCELEAFEIEHTKPGDVQETLRKLGVGVEVKTGQSTRLKATLRTPKGNIGLS